MKIIFLFLFFGFLSFLGAQPQDLESIEPPEGIQPHWKFYKPNRYLKIEPFNVHLFATSNVSEWMIHESYRLIYNMILSLKYPKDRAQFLGHQAFLITDQDPALNLQGQRNTGGRGFSLFNEDLVCREAVDTLYPAGKPIYRAWDTPVHEFGHAIERTLGLELKSDNLFSKHIPNYNPKVAREYFAWGVQTWFSSTMDKTDRSHMPKWQYDYFSEIFDVNYSWIPTVTREIK